MDYARIGDTCLVGDGTHSKIQRHDSGVLYLTSRNFKDGNLDVSKVYYISESDYAKHFLSESKALACPRPEDLVFSIIGTIGEPYLVRNTDRWGISSSVAIVRPKRDIIDPGFLLYWFKGPVFQSALFGIKGGVAQGYVSLEMIRSLPVPQFSLPVQKRIAGILSAYDELIENRQQHIKILEAMARALYHEWFVHFRFPGHENHPRVASSLGEISQGWEVGELGDLVQFKSGFAFKTDAFVPEGKYRLVTIKNVQDGWFLPDSDNRLDELPKKLPAHCVLENGDILLSLTGNVGRACLVFDAPLLLNQRVSKLVPTRNFDWALVYCVFRDPAMRRKLEQLSNGVAQQNLSPILAAHVECVLPPQELREEFSRFATPMIKAIVQLYAKIQNLRRARDLLLPRLLSGQIEVEAV